MIHLFMMSLNVHKLHEGGVTASCSDVLRGPSSTQQQRVRWDGDDRRSSIRRIASASTFVQNVCDGPRCQRFIELQILTNYS